MTTNTSRGLEFYRKVSEEAKELINVEREYKERLQYKPSLIHPFERHPLNAEFVKLYKEKGYLFAIHNVLHNTLRTEQIKSYLNYWTFSYRVPRKLIKILFKIK